MTAKLQNLSDITPKIRDVELLHPGTRAPLGIVLKMVSREDARVKATQRGLQDLALQQQQRKKVPTAVQLENNTISLIASSIIGWDWSKSTVEWNGSKSPEFSNDAVKAFMREFEWARDQLDIELADDASFFVK